MKKILSVALIGAGFMSASAFAFDGTVNFNGQVTAVACTVTIDGGSATGTVTLPTVSTMSLPSAGSTAGATPFTFQLTGCSPSSVNAHVYFETSSPAIDATSGNLNNMEAIGTAAQNVQLQLLNEANGPINLAAADGAQNTLTYTTSMGAATMPFKVRYYATGAAMPGLVTSQVNYSMVYN